MSAFFSEDSRDGFKLKLWRGERMCLLGFDVEEPEPDLVGFSIEVRAPGSADWVPLKNRLAFSYSQPVEEAVDGSRNFDSTEAPFQKFRWIHFPWTEDPTGEYRYRVTKQHMPQDNKLVSGTALEAAIGLDPVLYEGFLDVGFTRNFASSQAYADRFQNNPNVIPSDPEDGLDFDVTPVEQELSWLGFEARAMMLSFLDEFVTDQHVTLDVFAYDFNEPEILERLEKYGNRVRAIIDDSSKKKKGVVTGHGATNSVESRCAKRLRASAGAGNVKRTHFSSLQHNKLFIAKRNGVPFKVLTGSTNFTFRGIYIQANNALVFEDQSVAKLYEAYFDECFNDPNGFSASSISKKWHSVALPDRPRLSFCFSPHKDAELSLNPIAGAVEQASSSVFYAVAFLNQIKSGPTIGAFNRLMKRPVFSYGVVDKRGELEVRKPDHSIGLVDFNYLAKKAPEPFKSEWSGGKGINIHHKFVVTDFNLETAKVFTGSCNMSPSGEAGNGDNLILIEDRKIAQSYAIEALRVFDHLHFRSVMQDKLDKKKPLPPLTLRKPKKITGKPAWFDDYYEEDSQKERDRRLFSR